MGSCTDLMIAVLVSVDWRSAVASWRCNAAWLCCDACRSQTKVACGAWVKSASCSASNVSRRQRIDDVAADDSAWCRSGRGDCWAAAVSGQGQGRRTPAARRPRHVTPSRWRHGDVDCTTVACTPGCDETASATAWPRSHPLHTDPPSHHIHNNTAQQQLSTTTWPSTARQELYPCPEKLCRYILPITLTDYQNSLTDRLSSKFLIKW